MSNLKMNNCVFAKKFTHSLRSFVGFNGYLNDELVGPLTKVNSIGKFVYFSFKDKHLCMYLRNGDHLEYNLRFDGKINHENVLFRLGSGFIMTNLAKIKIVEKDNVGLSRSISNLGSDPTRTMNSHLFFKDVSQYFHLQKDRNICSFLLDQKIIAGLDSHYVDRILNKNFINPNRTIEDLEGMFLEGLIKSIVTICNRDFDLNFSNSNDLSKCTYCFGKLTEEYIGIRNHFWCKDCQNG